jgi:hypothetical protein
MTAIQECAVLNLIHVLPLVVKSSYDLNISKNQLTINWGRNNEEHDLQVRTVLHIFNWEPICQTKTSDTHFHTSSNENLSVKWRQVTHIHTFSNENLSVKWRQVTHIHTFSNENLPVKWGQVTHTFTLPQLKTDIYFQMRTSLLGQLNCRHFDLKT